MVDRAVAVAPGLVWQPGYAFDVRQVRNCDPVLSRLGANATVVGLRLTPEPA